MLGGTPGAQYLLGSPLEQSGSQRQTSARVRAVNHQNAGRSVT